MVGVTWHGRHIINSLHERSKSQWRRWLFRGWIAATVVIAVIIAIYPPFTPDGPSDGFSIVAIIPPLLILGLGIGIAWLAALVFSRRKDKTTPDT